MAGPVDRQLTPCEVAAVLRVSPGAVRQWVRTGLMAALRDPTGHYWIPESAIAAWRRPVVVAPRAVPSNGHATHTAPQGAEVVRS